MQLVTERHHKNCKFYRAANCPIAIECEHGYDVCPSCDPCTCADQPPPDRTRKIELEPRS